jgi:hypothetical protein
VHAPWWITGTNWRTALVACDHPLSCAEVSCEAITTVCQLNDHRLRIIHRRHYLQRPAVQLLDLRRINSRSVLLLRGSSLPRRVCRASDANHIRAQRAIPPIWTTVRHRRRRNLWRAQHAQERSRRFEPLDTAPDASPCYLPLSVLLNLNVAVAGGRSTEDLHEGAELCATLR